MTLNEPVEIKVTISGRVPDALDLLRLKQGAPLRIWFLDDVTPGLRQPLPLLAAGVILRLRSRTDDDDDSTVKLRPCRRSQLRPRWATAQKLNGPEHRLEGDWTGTRRVLAVSSVLKLPAGHTAGAAEALGDLGAAFDSRQLEFLDECADLRVSLSGLTALGPISGTKWKDVGLHHAGGDTDDDGPKVDAERWTVGGLDFLELSIKVKAGDQDPEARKAAFEASVRAAGLPVDQAGTSKTEQVLTHLAGIRPPG